MQIIWNKINNKIKTDNNKLLNYRSCPVCSTDNSKNVLKIEKFQFFSDSDKAKQVDINQKQCRSCGAIYMNPCYSEEGFHVLFEEAGQSYGSSEGRPDEQVQWLKKYNLLKEGSKILDIGCGVGDFLASLPKNILKIGVDIDVSSINLAKEKYKDISFICSSFQNLKVDSEIDTITMYHVLEHLKDPLETLQRLNSLSHQETRLVVEVPIIENGLTNDINGFFSVQHLTHFSRKSFKNILLLGGWEIVDWSEQKDYNGCRILAKKQEPQERLNYIEDTCAEYINVYQYLSYWYTSLERIENKLSKINENKCVIWGGGMHLEFLYQTTSLFTKDIKFIIIDNDKNKQNKTWRGIKIYSPEVLSNIDKIIPIIISSYGGQSAIEKDALFYKFEKSHIIKLYDFIRVY